MGTSRPKISDGPSVASFIRTIPDFPEPGIMFRDVTTLFGDPNGLALAIDQTVEAFSGDSIDHVAGIEARGFILGGAVAHRLGAGFVAIRKKGKLPFETIEEAYQLEYGEAVVEIHTDAVGPGERVLIVDDLLATGGTALASVRLLQRLGAEVVACCFVVDLRDLGGSAALAAHDIPSVALCSFNGE